MNGQVSRGSTGEYQADEQAASQLRAPGTSSPSESRKTLFLEKESL